MEGEENTGSVQMSEAGGADDLGDVQDNVKEPGKPDAEEWEDLAEWQGVMQAEKDDENDSSEEDGNGNAFDSNESDKDDIDDHVVANEGEELDDDIDTDTGYGAL